jgi:hypothetical protein
MTRDKSQTVVSATQSIESLPGAIANKSEAKDVVSAIEEATLARRILPLNIHPDRMLPRHFTDAIEQVHSPSKTFWSRIDAERFADELDNYDPTYMAAVSQSWAAWGCGSFREDLVNAIRTKQFDEFCACWLMSLPQGQVSNDDDDVYELLHTHLHRTGNSTHLRYLELDGVKAVRHIREKMDNMVC